MQTLRMQNNRYELCLFLFSNGVGLKNNTRNYRKAFELSGVKFYLDKP